MILFSGNSKRDLVVIIPKAVIIVCHCPERTVHTKASFLCYADSVAHKSVKVKKNFCDLKHISKTAESADFLFAVFCDTILDGKFKTETRKMNHEYLYYLQKPF